MRRELSVLRAAWGVIAAASLGIHWASAQTTQPVLIVPRPWGTTFPGVVHDAHVIKGFVEEDKWLSNFYPCQVEVDGLVYGSAEAAYQAGKFPRSQRQPYANLAAPEAKKLAHSQKIDEREWETRRDAVMRQAVWAKFSQNPDLARMLIATGGKVLEETNWWDDEYWGVYQGKGENMLGRILMETRAKLAAAPDAGVAFTASFERSRYFFGEPAYVNVVIRNLSDRAIQVSRDKSMGFRLEAESSTGDKAEDHWGEWDIGGGASIRPTPLHPGGSVVVRLMATQFLEFHRPGLYTVTVTPQRGRDVQGWPSYPTAKAAAFFQEPTPSQATTLISFLFAGFDGGRGYSLLRDPIYLPLLAPYAEEGSFQALHAIDSIETPAATAELIRLANLRLPSNFVDQAWAEVSSRMPRPRAQSQSMPEWKRRKIRRCWDPSVQALLESSANVPPWGER